MSGQPGQQQSSNLLKQGGNSNMGVNGGMMPPGPSGPSGRWTPNDLTAFGKAQQQQKVNALQQGGFDALFKGAQPVQGMGSMEDLLYSGNQFFNPFGSATSYSADQVRKMQETMPMSVGETSRVLYKGNVYDNPMGGQMAAWNAMTPQQRNQMVQQIQGAGANTWREQDYMSGGGTAVPGFDQLGMNTGAAQTVGGAPVAAPTTTEQPAPSIPGIGPSGGAIQGMNTPGAIGGKGGMPGGGYGTPRYTPQYSQGQGYMWNPAIGQDGSANFGQAPGGWGNRYANVWRF